MRIETEDTHLIMTGCGRMEGIKKVMIVGIARIASVCTIFYICRA